MNRAPTGRTFELSVRTLQPLAARPVTLPGLGKYFRAGLATLRAAFPSPCDSCCRNCPAGRAARHPRRRKLCPIAAAKKNVWLTPDASLEVSNHPRVRPRICRDLEWRLIQRCRTSPQRHETTLAENRKFL